MFGRLPADARDQLGIRSEERVVGWGRSGNDVIAATDRALYLQAGERIGWHRIDKVIWDEPDLALVLVDEPQVRRLRLDTPRDLPPAARSCVIDSVVVSERTELRPGQGAMLVARRDADADEIRWSVVFDAGLDPQDAGLRALATERLDHLRQAMGI